MSIKLLDISFWQGAMDFNRLKSAGHNHIILRAGYGTTKDSKFDEYAKGCQKAGINIVGVYWFIYATNISEVQANAKKCLEVIKPYNIPIVFADFEYDTITKAKQKGVSLGSKECNSFTNTFCEAIKKAGYIPGYYANTDYYKNMYTSEVKNKGYVFWLAEYKSNHAYHEPSIPCDFFQYTDRGTVSTIPGKTFDTNVCFSEKYLNISSSNNSSNTSNISQGGNSMSNTNEKAIDALIKIAEQEIGYLEKKSNSQLDDKTANAGSANYTKYWRDLKPSWNGSAWCAVFVSWCMVQAFGMETAKKLLKHESDFPYVYCPTLGSRFTKYSDPQKGDVVIFYRNGEFAHTGIVIKVEGDKFWTIEGNTSGGSTIIANGGGVCKKSYYNSKLPGTKFCRPDYSIVKSINSSNNSSSTPSPSSNKRLIKQAQKELNSFLGINLAVDGVAGQATKTAFRKAIQKALNKDYKAGLVEDGVIGDKTNAVLKKVSVKKGSKGYMVSAVEIGMLLNGFDPKGVEYPGVYGDGLFASICRYQLSKGLDGKGIVAKRTFAKLVE